MKVMPTYINYFTVFFSSKGDKDIIFQTLFRFQ